jgi:LuxR family transcriptional regulator, maltose regulon positive regulatory protein
MKEDLPGADDTARSPLSIAVDRPLLYTKLHIPGTTPSLLSRPRLNERLHLRPDGTLTLLSAPAGFGKSTLVIDWVRRQKEPVAWLTLDEQDNDPILFWRYLIAALQVVDGRLGQQAAAILSAYDRISLETAVTLLINDISNVIPADGILTLVLDDFHWIHTASIFQSFNYLLQHQPPQLHLILLTRADPPLSLARLRVTGRLEELRAADLRLTQPEMAAFFTETTALNLSEDNLLLLAEQTEGWAAGLQLAALYLRRQEDVTHLVQTFAGIKQHVFAYLMEEVLRHQTEEVRQFLQQTAVLRQFCGPLCAAVTGQADAGSLLHKLVSDNLFITPLDDAQTSSVGNWFRYHPLFAEMLRANLDDDARRECHRRAARWYAGRQLIQDAVRNALAAEDYEFMAALLTQTYKTFLAQGLLVSLQKWLATLPPAYQSPRLRLAGAWCRVYEIGEPDVDRIISSISAIPAEAGPSFQGEILAVRAVYASLYGRLDQSIEWANKALTLIEIGDYLSFAAAYQALGNAYRGLGQLDAAQAAYSQAHGQFMAMGNFFMAQLPLYRIAGIQVMQGRLHHAWQTVETLRSRALDAGYEPLIMAGEVFGQLSDLFLEWNNLQEAYTYARQEIELARSGDMLLALIDGYLKLAAVAAAQGDEDMAREALDLAVETAVPLHSAPIAAQIAMHRARHGLRWGNHAAAISWADEYDRLRRGSEHQLTPLLSQSADLLLARIRLAQGKSDEALELLQEAVPELEAGGRIRLLVEARVLQALAWHSQSQEIKARKALTAALALGEPENYIQVFVENDPALVPLLQQVRHLFPEYVAELLRAMPGGSGADTPETGLLAPLTERELEIISLIAQGYSNRQIADAIFITVGTVKGHVNHIFSKLDVQNRTQALLRARELKLLD